MNEKHISSFHIQPKHVYLCEHVYIYAYPRGQPASRNPHTYRCICIYIHICPFMHWLGQQSIDATDVPPQPNSIPDYVFPTDQPSNGTSLFPKIVVVQASMQRKSSSTGSSFPADYPKGRSLGSGFCK